MIAQNNTWGRDVALLSPEQQSSKAKSRALAKHIMPSYPYTIHDSARHRPVVGTAWQRLFGGSKLLKQRALGAEGSGSHDHPCPTNCATLAPNCCPAYMRTFSAVAANQRERRTRQGPGSGKSGSRGGEGEGLFSARIRSHPAPAQ